MKNQNAGIPEALNDRSPERIRYNVYLLANASQARRIASTLCGADRDRDPPPPLEAVTARGDFVDEYRLARVVIALTDYRKTPPHVLFEVVAKKAGALNAAVVGSEFVDPVPLELMTMAADHYIEREHLFILDVDQKLRLAINRLGLNAVTPFDPRERIIAYHRPDVANGPLTGLSAHGFIDAVGARTTAPAGGAAAAYMASLGAALGAMVAKLTYGVRKFEPLDGEMRRLIPPLDAAFRALIPMVDADARAYRNYVAALQWSAKTAEDREHRRAALQDRLKTAIQVPLKTMRLADGSWDALREVARVCSMTSRADVEVGARALEVGIWGSGRNVVTNAAGIEDIAYRTRVVAEAEALTGRARQQCDAVLRIYEARAETLPAH